jgi:hypothetical protein
VTFIYSAFSRSIEPASRSRRVPLRVIVGPEPM